MFCEGKWKGVDDGAECACRHQATTMATKNKWHSCTVTMSEPRGDTDMK